MTDHHLLASSLVIELLVEQVVDVILKYLLSILLVDVLEAAVIAQLLSHCEELAKPCELLVFIKQLLECFALLHVRL